MAMLSSNTARILDMTQVNGRQPTRRPLSSHRHGIVIPNLQQLAEVFRISDLQPEPERLAAEQPAES